MVTVTRQKAIRWALTIGVLLLVIGVGNWVFARGSALFKDGVTEIGDNVQINGSLVLDTQGDRPVGRPGDFIVEGTLTQDANTDLVFCDSASDDGCNTANRLVAVSNGDLTVEHLLDGARVNAIIAPAVNLNAGSGAVTVSSPITIDECYSNAGQNCGTAQTQSEAVRTNSVSSSTETIELDTSAFAANELVVPLSGQNICFVQTSSAISGQECPIGYRDGGYIDGYTSPNKALVDWSQFLLKPGTTDPKPRVCCKLDGDWPNIPRGSVTIRVRQLPLGPASDGSSTSLGGFSWNGVDHATTKFKLFVDGIDRGIITDDGTITVSGLSKLTDHVATVQFYDKDSSSKTVGISGNWIEYWDPGQLVSYEISITGGTLTSGQVPPVTQEQHNACFNSAGWWLHGYNGTHYWLYPSDGAREKFCFTQVTTTGGKLQGQALTATYTSVNSGSDTGLGEANAGRGVHTFSVN